MDRGRNEVTGCVGGPVVQVGGAVQGGININALSVPSAVYEKQVAELAPDVLEDRESELALLAAFCAEELPEEGGYLWWRAGAWAGKSALLSWFVLNPPPGVRVVSFFVTSRLPGQNDRRGFVDSVLDQLHALAGLPARSDLAEATREPYLLHLLTSVADRVRAGGERFVLVVDGLDEDQGVTGSPDAHSIAALLPRTGVRVVVSGRPNPELPDDVPPHHPLRGSARVEELMPAPRAEAVRDTMTRDLTRLLRGNRVQRDLLGFVTAASGWLTAGDLAELTGASRWQVENELRTVAGRSFTRRPDEEPVHLLAHERLHSLAVEMLERDLPAYRDRIQEWADSYRERGWPESTPRYLLRGHARMLIANGDVRRALDHVTDVRRYELAASVFGGNQVAIEEIEAAQALLFAAEEPDLAALARLSVHGTSLRWSGHWIPTALPQAWAAVGRFDHAESLIALMDSSVGRVFALLGVARQNHEAGRGEQATRLLDVIESMVRMVNQFWGVRLYTDLVELSLLTGEHDRAWRVVADVQRDKARAELCAVVALGLLEAGEREQAERWYRASVEAIDGEQPARDVELHAALAAVAARLGDQERAGEQIAVILELVAPSGASPPSESLDLPGADNFFQAFVRRRSTSPAILRQVVELLARGGIEDVALTIANREDEAEGREEALFRIVVATARRGRLADAEALARTAVDARGGFFSLAVVAQAAEEQGDQNHFERLVHEALAAGEHLPGNGPRRRSRLLAVLLAIGTGRRDEAVRQVGSELLPDHDWDGALAAVESLVRHGDLERASRVLELLERAARATVPDPDEKGVLRWISVLVDFGDLGRAEVLAFPLKNEDVRALAWAKIAEGRATRGDVRRFTEALRKVENSALRRVPILEMTRVLLARGAHELAVELARSAQTEEHRASALAFIAERTYDKELLTEVSELVTAVESLDRRERIAFIALRAAANLADRGAVASLRDHLAEIHQEMDRRAGKRPGTSTIFHTRTVALTEVAERVDGSLRLTSSPDRAPVVDGGAPPLWGPAGLEVRQWLANILVVDSWFTVVDRLLEVAPEVYPAITAELARLHHRGSPDLWPEPHPRTS
ncbi:hypothetical protein KCV87_34275 [Actinosynnema pretiosum subsp. pretiosum]|uniref:Uncharacterized protein n=1 Tax=Actinosynnema pretiosum subsp. pretiosum TaxID=103721 RepID=A0AA45R419_9PSEU|nr:hypothetical protein APASM_4294 [Actinosynnema pretiosum subsp. pretiosum]QUF04324.1 hypothetical protein KCV87_34275 [Actinosynnema pretiosum subsp. pretiosum]